MILNLKHLSTESGQFKCAILYCQSLIGFLKYKVQIHKSVKQTLAIQIVNGLL